MISELDKTIKQLLIKKADKDSKLAQAAISFEIPDNKWRKDLNKLTVNCYLYDIHENRELRTCETSHKQNKQEYSVSRIQPPVRIDCVYCITAWSPAQNESALEEHELLSQVLRVLLKNRTIDKKLLQGSLVDQVPPYPTVIALPDGIKNQPQFWGALDQQLKPSLNYCVTLAMFLDDTDQSYAIKHMRIYAQQ